MSASSAECARPARSVDDAGSTVVERRENVDYQLGRRWRGTLIIKRSRNPARAARRKTELRERLGAERPACIYCGHAELVALRRVSRKYLREHHVLGRHHDPDLTVFVCLNCHALVHDEKLPDAEVDLKRESDPIKRVAAMLRAEAVHFEMLASSKRRQAALLEGRTQ